MESGPWARSFALEAIKIGSAEAWGVRAGSEAAICLPEFTPAAEEAPQAQEIRTIFFGSVGVSTPEAVVAAVRDSTTPTRIVAPANEREKIRAAVAEGRDEGAARSE